MRGSYSRHLPETTTCQMVQSTEQFADHFQGKPRPYHYKVNIGPTMHPHTILMHTHGWGKNKLKNFLWGCQSRHDILLYKRSTTNLKIVDKPIIEQKKDRRKKYSSIIVITQISILQQNSGVSLSPSSSKPGPA